MGAFTLAASCSNARETAHSCIHLQRVNVRHRATTNRTANRRRRRLLSERRSAAPPAHATERVQCEGYFQRERNQSRSGAFFHFRPLSLGGKRVHMSSVSESRLGVENIARHSGPGFQRRRLQGSAVTESQRPRPAKAINGVEICGRLNVGLAARQEGDTWNRRWNAIFQRPNCRKRDFFG